MKISYSSEISAFFLFILKINNNSNKNDNNNSSNNHHDHSFIYNTIISVTFYIHDFKFRTANLHVSRIYLSIYLLIYYYH